MSTPDPNTWEGVGNHAISAVGTGIKWYLIIGGIVSLIAIVGFFIFAVFVLHWFGHETDETMKHQDDEIDKQRHDFPLPNQPLPPLIPPVVA